MPDGNCANCGVPLSKRWAKRGICRQCAAKGMGSQNTPNENDDSEDKFWDYLFSKWWGHLLLALLLFGCAWLVYDYITGLEQTGQRGRINWLIALVYAAAGKIGAVSCFGLPAIVLTISGLVKLAHLGR